eukprot:353906_1
MSLNCTQLVADSMDTISNNGSVLWLEHDETEIKMNYTDPDPPLWLPICVFTILLILNLLTSYYYIYYDKQQQKIAVNSHSSVHDTVRPYLEAYDLSTELMNIIFEFADIKPLKLVIESKWIYWWSDSNLETKSMSTKQIIRTRFILYFSLTIFTTLNSFLSYVCILHWNDSYRSYVEIECIVHFDLDKLIKKKHYLYEFDVQNLCMNGTEIVNDYTFYASIPYLNPKWKDIGKDTIPSCYIHKKRFTVRGYSECCECDCSRCGATPKECNCCICANGCCYCCFCFMNLGLCITAPIIAGHRTKKDIKGYDVTVSVHNPTVMLHCLN